MKKSSAISAVLKLMLLILVSCLMFAGVPAQKTEHYNSPLYSPRTYDPTQGTSNGMPPALEKVGIEQKLDSSLPLEAEFKDENGKTVKLGEYFGKGRPIVLALVYYECPMLCNEVLNGLTGSLKGITFDAGKDFDVIAISFDARENDKPELAKNKKASYLARYERKGTENGWHFLTGTQSEIDKVTQAVGFNYSFDAQSNQFAHAGGIMIVTPEGRLSRYFYGIDYQPRDLKFGIMESAQSKIGNPAEQLYLYCFHYDPATGRYGLMILRVMRLAAVATILGLGGMLFIFWRRNKRKERNLI
ncbi:MAG: SCO family protein [Pyrinomonadaceae bacterium]